ncbi:acyl-CoA dehydrogenase family protein [Actinokineospora pegani]|uniref:acyl-CoA dehydrogenase family protein n=1 Tax=Actinokineospora pegani TaxID=2654637 RepID=UPI001F206C29|nr:acyl-CoA dehydrogenase family protein [Actinokineospora pegani]
MSTTLDRARAVDDGLLGSAHVAACAGFAEFVDRRVVPIADDLHRSQYTPPQVIDELGRRGLLGLPIPAEYGGGGCDAVTLGLLAAELGRGCSSLRSLLTVHTMVAHVLARWGSRAQRETWLPRLASGECVAALALSEPEVGSDATAVRTRVERDGDELVLHGHKKWITYGHVADLLLVVARGPEGPTAVLVERSRPGVRTRLITGMIGIRASMTADVHLDGVRVPADHLLGRPGLGTTQIAGTALDLGRYTVAWGSVGIIAACLGASVAYADTREQFGAPIREHQLVRRLISDMYADYHASRLLCLDAGVRRDRRDPAALPAASLAKYTASTAAVRAASDAVQVHGANGCGSEYPVQRYLGDAKVMEVIEGTTQLHQVGLADHAFHEFGGFK